MVAKRIADRGPRAIQVDLPTAGPITVYAGVRISRALEDLLAEMDLFHGVKLAQVLEAIYVQGQLDGRHQVFEGIENLSDSPELKHRKPGRPAKKKAPAKKAPAKRASTKKVVAKKAVKRVAKKKAS